MVDIHALGLLLRTDIGKGTEGMATNHQSLSVSHDEAFPVEGSGHAQVKDRSPYK